ncbi:Uncharacterized protein TCAP_01343 [Tolypocladium capitatum]|uniref:Uncharacterized protein n=1 Tax=Tolypocladium capitatum TaxID=45235 RepID=A0A2K3QMI5_9HYPO|nr:Uncharacterized protein TCAP_01343 [Tolypocladium capitatum]
MCGAIASDAASADAASVFRPTPQPPNSPHAWKWAPASCPIDHSEYRCSRRIMDSSPLVKAHDHAAAAAAATTRQASDTTVAISEHTQAAGEFANAARHTTSIEALRTLKLLEAHHRKLAEILRLPPEPASQAGDDDLGEKSREADGGRSADDDARSKGDARSRTAQMPGLPQQRRFASREMSSSIASNLASARGIRSKYRGQPLSPTVSNDQAPGNVDAHPRRDGSRAKMQNIIDHQTGKPTWVPPTSPPPRPDGRARSAASPRAEASPPANEDAGYARFYSTFGSLINKISAPLAFAGLPLIREESSTVLPEQAEPADARTRTPSPSSNRKAARPPSSVTLEPDLSKIYSKATMRALAREGHSASDSFYVVPTSGHTMSYANILTYAEKEKRRLEASAHDEPAGPADEDEDDFVDARETLVPLSPGAKRRVVARGHAERNLRNTVEELSLENKSLKEMLDNVSRRLHAFEASSQHSAMALAESYRVMRPGSPTAAAPGKSVDDAVRKKTQDMEEQLAAAARQVERLEKDNRKMQKTLDKYREKWDMLKAGAKARREAQTGESVEDARQG